MIVSRNVLSAVALLLAVMLLSPLVASRPAFADGEAAGDAEAAPLSAQQRERAHRMIKRLDGESVTVVRSAFETLQGMGEPVLEELEQALATSENAKMQDRLRQIIEAIKIDSINNHAVHLDMILEEVRRANRDQVNEDKLEALLERLTLAIQAGTEDDSWEMPVHFGDVTQRKTPQNARGRHGNNQLVVEKKVEMSIVQNSIVLSDSTVQISSARDSIIVARVATRISSARNCIIISGVASETSSLDGCICLAGVSNHVSSATRSVLGSSEPVQISSGRTGTLLMNQKPDQRAVRRGVQGVVVGGVVLRDKEAKNPLEGIMTVTHVHIGDGGLALFRLKDGTGEYVARTDQEIRHPDGKPVEELADWKLRFTGRNFVVFGDGEKYSHLTLQR